MPKSPKPPDSPPPRGKSKAAKPVVKPLGEHLAALRFVITQAAHLGVDARRVVVGGDSAGGTGS